MINTQYSKTKLINTKHKTICEKTFFLKPLVYLKHTEVSSGHGPTCLPSFACSWSPPLPRRSLWSCVSHRHQTPPQTSRAQCELHWGQCLTHTQRERERERESEWNERAGFDLFPSWRLAALPAVRMTLSITSFGTGCGLMKRTDRLIFMSE